MKFGFCLVSIRRENNHHTQNFLQASNGRGVQGERPVHPARQCNLILNPLLNALLATGTILCVLPNSMPQFGPHLISVKVVPVEVPATESVQKRTSDLADGMSASDPRADITSRPAQLFI